MKKISKNQKYGIIAAVAVIVVVLAASWVGPSETFQGFLRVFRGSTVQYTGQVYKYKNKYVTPVASPVTSVVLSTVTSPAGPSLVASAVTSPVASAVQLAQSALKNINLTAVPMLTADVLRTTARADFINNPARYQLSNAQRMQIINTYKLKYPQAFRLGR